MKENIIQWIRDWFETQSNNADGIVIGISGGKDSTVVAKLCVEAIGKENVLGVLMPNGDQKDIKDSFKVCELLGIKSEIINIKDTEQTLLQELFNNYITPSREAIINVAPRLRMITLYTIAQTKNYRVAGTGNATEKVLGYFTKWGDGAHDFNPIGMLTCTQVIELGRELGLPEELITKTPSDGLTGKTDEEQFGYTYAEIDYVIENELEEGEVFEFINNLYNKNLHKLLPIPTYGYDY